MSDKGLSRIFAVLFAFGAGVAKAAPVDLATTPMVSGVTRSVAPNVQFIMDDSTSMNWEFMPDAAWANATRNCFKNHGYNRIYYNPSITYAPPKKAEVALPADGFHVQRGISGQARVGRGLRFQHHGTALGLQQCCDIGQGRPATATRPGGACGLVFADQGYLAESGAHAQITSLK